MKTAISLPDDTYARATRRARELGVSRSEFFAQAAQRYLDQLDASSLTSQIDEAVVHAVEDGPGDDSSAWAVTAGHRRLAASSEEW